MKPEDPGSQGKGPSGSAGQQKTHTATRILPDGTTESRDFTQEQWRQRDKSEGWQRPDGDADDAGDTGSAQ